MIFPPNLFTSPFRHSSLFPLIFHNRRHPTKAASAGVSRISLRAGAVSIKIFVFGRCEMSYLPESAPV